MIEKYFTNNNPIVRRIAKIIQTYQFPFSMSVDAHTSARYGTSNNRIIIHLCQPDSLFILSIALQEDRSEIFPINQRSPLSLRVAGLIYDDMILIKRSLLVDSNDNIKSFLINATISIASSIQLDRMGYRCDFAFSNTISDVCFSLKEKEAEKSPFTVGTYLHYNLRFKDWKLKEVINENKLNSFSNLIIKATALSYANQGLFFLNKLIRKEKNILDVILRNNYGIH